MIRTKRKPARKKEPGKDGFDGEAPESECVRTLKFIPSGGMDRSMRVLEHLERPPLEELEISDENVRLIGSMKDDLQLWNAIVIVAHIKVIKGESTIGKEMEGDVVMAIRDLSLENISEGMAKRLGFIAENSPNELARAAARKKLEGLI